MSQILTQVGGNMVLFGLTVEVFSLTDSSTSVSILLLTFLVPAVVFGAIAGVFVDRYDRRWILIGTNVARGALFLSLVFLPDQLWLIYVVTALVATLTTFFAPAEAAMIPLVVKREQLMTANGLFIFALQASFVLGFAVLGPLAQNILGTQALIVIVAGAYGLAGLMCWILPAAPPIDARVRRRSARPSERSARRCRSCARASATSAATATSAGRSPTSRSPRRSSASSASSDPTSRSACSGSRRTTSSSSCCRSGSASSSASSCSTCMAGSCRGGA